mmetsp:Transcript_126174/g.188285  ORF Transcript_126174/g.188285 Transcript_126174/m.188285 type:complete len:428 (-) Transcript_126174:89-1372(-)
MATNSPKDAKKKKEDKKKWRGFGNPVAKIFNRKDSDKKLDGKDEPEESEEIISGSPSKPRTQTISTTHGNKIQREGSLISGVQPRQKPHPLLRPKSLVSIVTDGIIHEEEPAKEAPPVVKAQFGLHPTELVQRFPDEPVPAILVACIDILEADIRREGIFRIPGRMTTILEMRVSFEGGNGLGVEDPCTLDIAGLVAQFFRELPEPLLMYDLYYNWIESVKKENEEKIRESVKEMLSKIPEANYNILQYFIRFLANVGKNSGANRMGPRNLALVFGASLLNPPAIDQYDLANIKLQCSVIEHMITGYAYIFENEVDTDANSQKVREKQVATIPAGNPNAPPANLAPAGENRRKGFMKRKSTFFTNISHSSSRNADMITLTSKPPASPRVSPTESEEDKKRKKGKRKKTRQPSDASASQIDDLSDSDN